MDKATNTDDGRISIDGHEMCRSEIDALRRLVKTNENKLQHLFTLATENQLLTREMVLKVITDE